MYNLFAFDVQKRYFGKTIFGEASSCDTNFLASISGGGEAKEWRKPCSYGTRRIRVRAPEPDGTGWFSPFLPFVVPPFAVIGACLDALQRPRPIKSELTNCFSYPSCFSCPDKSNRIMRGRRASNNDNYLRPDGGARTVRVGRQFRRDKINSRVREKLRSPTKFFVLLLLINRLGTRKKLATHTGHDVFLFCFIGPLLYVLVDFIG